MDALQYLNLLTRSTEEFLGFKEVSWEPPFNSPRNKTLTDRYTQAVMIDGAWFTVTVEKIPEDQ